jgi:hypothetical protein
MHASALSVFRFPENTCIPQAQPKAQGAVTEQSPGVAVMTDLMGEKPMRQINERNILRHDLSVADVMTPLSQLERQLGRALPEAMPHS